jgi:FKBP-type peptidyl-prolyl cis-trans isomerase
MRPILFAALLLCLFSACKKEDQTEIDAQLIAEHIAANPDLAGMEATASGLHYLIQDSGSVDHPGITSEVVVFYTGTLLDGTRFDGVNPPSDAAQFPLSYTILGWQEGIPLLGRGGRGVFLIPSHLGYGEDAVGSIPKNSVLKFEVELVDFN